MAENTSGLPPQPVESSHPVGIDPQVRPFMPDLLRRFSQIKPETITPDEFAETINPFYERYLLDHGLQRPADFMHQGVVHEAPPVHMLGRSGLLTHLEELMRDFNPNDFQVPAGVPGVHMATLDIAQLRNMNYAGAGDYGLNRAAAKLQEKVTAINNTLREQYGGEVAVGRIGGDEFMLVLYGMTQEQAQTHFNEVINKTDGIQSVESFYKDAPDEQGMTEAEKRKIALKEEPFVSIPTDEERRQVMISYLKKGIILEPNHIERILERQRQGVTESVQEPSSQSARERLDHIVTIHPELADMAATIQNWAGVRGNSTDTSLQDRAIEEFVHFVEGVVYDRLLGENVRTFDDLAVHAIAGDLSEMFVFDFKGLKELNDYVSLVDGDRAIQATFKSVTDIIKSEDEGEEDESGNVMYFRRGGTIVVAGRRKSPRGDSELSEKKRVKLKTLQTTSLEEGGEVHQFDLGVSYTPIHGLKDMEKTARRTIGHTIESAELAWYQKMAADLAGRMAQDGGTDSVHKILSEQSGLPPSAQTVSNFGKRDALLKAFFHGKRREERMKTLQKVAANLMNSSDNEANIRFSVLASAIPRLLQGE